MGLGFHDIAWIVMLLKAAAELEYGHTKAKITSSPIYMYLGRAFVRRQTALIAWSSVTSEPCRETLFECSHEKNVLVATLNTSGS
jgi:hypothetical protein